MTAHRVRDFLTEFRDLTRTSANEEELRSAFNSAAVSMLGIRDLKLERGRQDVRRNRVIIEFKDKGLFLGTTTSAKFQEALDQLVNDYIPNQAANDGRQASDYIGVCFDGVHLAFVFVESNGSTRVSDLRPFDEHSAGALVLALDRDDRIELTAQNVVDDFGPGSAVASTLLGALWCHLNASLAAHVNRVEMLYTEWNDLFEQSTSLGRIGQARLDTYLQSIGLPLGADPTRVLFVLHTYHALVFKLLAAELVLANALVPGTRSGYCFGVSALNDTALVASLERDIEESELFRQVNVLNFVEGTFFAWYLVSPPTRLVEAIRNVMQRLSLYRLTGLQLGRTRDIVKRVYQQLVPRALRHNIGEFFTPEWLVEFTLDRTDYQGAGVLDKRFLDPCCGSGNFLIHAIERYKTQARLAGWDDAKTLRGIIDHIYGFDLNPLAVLTARVNYLIAISDLIATHSEVEIPVYQADAVYAPTASGGGASITRIYRIGTRVRAIDLELPETLIQRNRLFSRILEIMERTIRHGDSEAVFVASLYGEHSYTAESSHNVWEPFLRDMFRKVEALEQIPWDRIWCRIVRNYFASVALGECQFIASNPPWVRWSELPGRYTERIKPTCESYGIFSADRYFGGNELDISGMITYTVADKWLADKGGRLSFVITHTHFQSQSSGGFRRFQVRGIPLRVRCVDDFVDVRPFAGLANKPAVLSLEKGQPTTYPVNYTHWERTTSVSIPEDVAWSTAQSQLTQTALEANHLSGPGQRWSILPPRRFAALRVLDGEDPNIEGRKGIVTDLNGAYFIELLGPGRIPNTVRFRNAPHEGRRPVPPRTDEIELDLVYPLIKGAENIRPFHATISPAHVIVPNRRITAAAIPIVTSLARSYPGALRYFRAINAQGVMEQRSTWRTRMAPQYDRRVQRGLMAAVDIPFYAIYDVGDYTFAPYKVVWAEMAGTLQAAVIGHAVVPYGGGSKSVVPDHKVYFAAFDDPDQAHYVCALLNSEPVRAFIDSFTIKIQVGTLFRHIHVPAYDPSDQDHRDLAQLSRDAHQILAAGGGTGSIAGHLLSIDNIVLRLVKPRGITSTTP
jgi:hypothetical protein